jgi:broad specificity phosphatase PhoE
MRRRLFLNAATLALLLAVPALARAQATTVIVVRHAERLDSSQDPPLNEVGQARAEALATALANAGVEAIYTTQFARTRLTAEPLARKLGVTATVVQAGGDATSHARAIADRIRSEAAGKVVLVVGHSNTVPAIVAALGGGDVGTIQDAQHDHMFIVRTDASGTRVIRAGYPPR